MILLDTHVLLWLDQDDPVLGAAARRKTDTALRDGAPAISAITFWEVGMLAVKERITMQLPLAVWRRNLLTMGLIEMPVDGHTAIAAAALPDFHGDPADRLIVATAISRDATLLTADQRILKWRGKIARIDARK